MASLHKLEGGFFYAKNTWFYAKIFRFCPVEKKNCLLESQSKFCFYIRHRIFFLKNIIHFFLYFNESSNHNHR